MLPKFDQLFCIFFLFLPYFVAPKQSAIYEYTSDNFKNRIGELDGNFIMFYAPWCSHCTDFHPIWQELADLINTKSSKFAIAQVDCTIHTDLCNENDITGYPTLLYFHKNVLLPVEYKGTRDLPSLTLFLSDIFNGKKEKPEPVKPSSEVKVYSGMAYLSDHNIEKFVSRGQHFIMFYAPWCKACQKLAPVWSELAVQYARHQYLQIGKVNCLENEITCHNFDIKQYPFLLWIVNGRVMGVSPADNFDDLRAFIETMVLAENHDPEKFLKKKKALPVARISEETFETFLESDLVFINYFAPWCAHCMQLSPLWLKLGEKFQNESRVLIADVDCVRSKAICEMEKINGLPTLILYKHKQVVSIDNGARPLESLITLVNDYLQDSPPLDSEQLSSDEQPSNEGRNEEIYSFKVRTEEQIVSSEEESVKSEEKDNKPKDEL